MRSILLKRAPHGPFIVHGSASGAQLAVAYAQAYRGDFAHMLLDHAAHFDPDERRYLLSHFSPDERYQVMTKHLGCLP